MPWHWRSSPGIGARRRRLAWQGDRYRHLARVNRLIVEARERIERQKARIFELEHAERSTAKARQLLRQFEMMGVYPLNESVAIGRSRDKLRSMQLLARDGIGLPPTAFANDPQRTDEILGLVGGAPVVIKLLEGTQGIGVILAETSKAAEAVIEAFRGLDANILVQEFIREARGSDIRVLVVGQKVVAAMRRTASAGEFRSNLHRGGTAEKIKLTPEERSTALRAAKAMGLAIAGVDLLRSNHGPVVMEVNSSPGLEGIEKASQIDVAAAVIKYIEKKAVQGKTKDRIRG